MHTSPRLSRKVLALCGAAAVFTSPAVACGPFFPNQLLFNSGASVLWAPVADFRREIELLPAKKAAFRPVAPPPEGNVFHQSTTLDVAELRYLLADLQVEDRKAELLVDGYSALRNSVREIAEAKEANAADPGAATRPANVKLVVPNGLPPEFDKYARGLAHYALGEMGPARAEWEGLLQLPAGQRQHHTAWAQFMIGKSYLTENPGEAVSAFERARAIVKEGAPDPLGLAAASIGWEARAEFNRDNDSRALGLYLEQYSAGDKSALQSLAVVCRDAFKKADPDVLRALASDALAARVVTAYALANANPFERRPDHGVVQEWLAAVEAAGTTAVIGADRLAWAAYQAGDIRAADRWLVKAPDGSPIALWLRAKMLARSGKLDQATTTLARAARLFPANEEWTSVPGGYDSGGDGPDGRLRPAQRVSAEAGVLELGRGHYVEALDQLLKAGWTLDAYYVAERVLTADELIAYVSANCPEGTHNDLRDLLARRLTRVGRWKEARPFFSADGRTLLDQYISAIRDGHDGSKPDEARAASLWTAAKLARTRGDSLMGDTFVDDIYSSFLKVPASRAKSEDTLLPPLPDELRRAAASAPTPARKWHYRFVAADHAWAAAELMPDQTDALAELLCEAGGWIKADEPKMADRFYKALVIRCSQTKLGREAGQKRWFPQFRPK